MESCVRAKLYRHKEEELSEKECNEQTVDLKKPFSLKSNMRLPRDKVIAPLPAHYVTEENLIESDMRALWNGMRYHPFKNAVWQKGTASIQTWRALRFAPPMPAHSAPEHISISCWKQLARDGDTTSAHHMMVRDSFWWISSPWNWSTKISNHTPLKHVMITNTSCVSQWHRFDTTKHSQSQQSIPVWWVKAFRWHRYKSIENAPRKAFLCDKSKLQYDTCAKRYTTHQERTACVMSQSNHTTKLQQDSSLTELMIVLVMRPICSWKSIPLSRRRMKKMTQQDVMAEYWARELAAVRTSFTNSR